MRGQADTYLVTKTFTYPEAVIRVHFPDLTEDERARRMRKIYTAASNLLKGVKNNEN